MGRPPVPLADRICDKVRPEDNGCWIWIASRVPSGYGKIWDGTRLSLAHRLFYEIFVGPIPDGLHLDHLCRNRACVNPGHLEPVTCRENILRGEGLAARNARATHCVRGHEFAPAKTDSRRVCRECARIRQQQESA